MPWRAAETGVVGSCPTPRAPRGGRELTEGNRERFPAVHQRRGSSGTRAPLFLPGVVKLPICLVQIAVQSAALVVVQTLPTLVAAPAVGGAEIAALPAALVAPLLGLRHR